MGDSGKAAPQSSAADKPQAKASSLPLDGGEKDSAEKKAAKKKADGKERTKDQPDDVFEGNQPDDVFEG